MKLLRIILAFLAILVSTTMMAQQLEVKRIELTSDEVVLHFSLLDSVVNRSYSINLYSSRDNYLNPLSYVSGDVGVQVKPGMQRKVIWNARQELGADFNDKISVELRARVYIPFILFDSFDKIKRGKPKEVTWRGGTPQNIMNFELYRGDKKVDVIPNIPNVGHTKLTIPAGVKPGKNYRFRIVDSKNKDQVVETETFVIKRKVPLLVMALPIVAIGGAVSLLGGDEGGGDSNIPDPPGTPN